MINIISCLREISRNDVADVITDNLNHLNVASTVRLPVQEQHSNVTHAQLIRHGPQADPQESGDIGGEICFYKQ